MVEASVTLTNNTGLHARPASQFISFVSKYAGTQITLVSGNRQANGKSILNVLAMGLENGAQVKVQVSGKDEQQALDEIIDFLKNLSA